MKKYLIVILSLLSVFLLFSCGNGNTKVNSINSELKIIKNNINLGEIPMDEGKVKIPFEFVNNGTHDVVLGKAETTCMCTEGMVVDDKGGNISSVIKMRGHGPSANLNRVIKPGEKEFLIAIFDPNAHGPNAVGPISRNIFIKTNSLTTKKLDFNFRGNVVKTRSDSSIKEVNNKLGEKEGFYFEEKSFDFGVIKQSGGKVSHNFKFTYNGDEPVKITGVPTSCACINGVVDKTELQSGDTGVLTVIFNPNLHEEPEGKFFKTVSLLTDREMKKIPELKVWVEIDLDLGEEAFELKSKHNDNH